MLDFEILHIHRTKEFFRLPQAIVGEVLPLLDNFGEPLDDEEDVIVVFGQVTLLHDDVVLQVNIEMNIIGEELDLRLVVMEVEQVRFTNGIF